MPADPEEVKKTATGRGETGRRAILDAAMLEFAEHGLEGARTRAIAQRAGQNLATLHYHFGTKEKLYLALAHAGVALFRPRLETLWEQASELVDSPTPDRAAARKLFGKILLALFDAIVANEHTIPLSRIVIREQMKPTAVFDVIYEGLLEPMHTALTHLLATAIGREARDPRIIAQTQAMLGQVFAFRAAREMLLRRTGWKGIGKAEAETIREALRANLNALFQEFDLAEPPPAHL